ncbi:MAG TPA: hypothetical protein PKA82_10115, partial [Pyrinomonadaceae bacterium]|nr:hypothetical protein [Pyrinomonadaceae bacterium]
MSKLSAQTRIVSFSLLVAFLITYSSNVLGLTSGVVVSEMGFVPFEPTSTASNAAFTIGTCDTAGPIEIESSGGTTTPTAYATLQASFAAIAAGTHTGAINVEVCGNTTETASAILDASGTGSYSYSSITIRPVGGARVIEGAIVGAIIKLNGADNVTIDGRQGGTGTARDLTVRNNS